MKIMTIKSFPHTSRPSSPRIAEAEKKWLGLIKDGKVHKVTDIGGSGDVEWLVRTLRYVGNKHEYALKIQQDIGFTICFQGSPFGPAYLASRIEWANRKKAL